ncbi:hypothetical protein LCGC14_2515920 [marine sediment metagenome]|uniref:Polymerase/histidinol phosphatase N-terminal domain-containing protein n=1 Tax=marine sediment metagenome TaxID=412755 RepID=A0A0F9AXR5_9ZZZZ
MVHYPVPDGLFDDKLTTRLETLSALTKGAKPGVKNRWINLHVHTNESFSYFRSPAEAVWHAYNQGVEYYGINDHYTIDGHGEFRSACKIMRLKAAFSVEAVAMDADRHKRNRRFNDPDNPGRIYIIGKGVVRDLEEGSREHKTLQTMRDSIRERNSKITEKMDQFCEEKGCPINFRYSDVRALTPRGNTTERHVAQAFCEKINSLYKETNLKLDIYKKLLNTEIDEDTLEDTAQLQTIVRAKLVKSGMPCYVEENSSAFTTIKNLVGIHRKYGTIPSYGLMGGPITEEEEDLEELVDTVTGFGMYAFDMFEFRTELNRAKDIIEIAAHNGIPVFIGTEHNTKTLLPLTGEIGKAPGSYEYLKKSADFLLGHQLLSELCGFGYLTEGGEPRFGNRTEGFDFFSGIGQMDLPDNKIEELHGKDLAERKKYFGI